MVDTALKPRTVRATGTVQAVERVTPHMQRITLGGREIAAFLNAEGASDAAAWVKVFLPSGESRAYTLRRIDHRQGTLDIDFVMHGDGADAGPAATWAAHARTGERLAIAGPRSGGFLLPGDASWVLLAGDATALPGIQSIASRLPSGIKAQVYLEVPSDEDRQPIDGPAGLRLEWIHGLRGQPGVGLARALLHRPLPPGPGYVWLAGESAAVRTLKRHYLDERMLQRHSVSAKGYWKAGEADHRDAG